MVNSEVNISHDGGAVSYSTHEDGSISGDFDLHPGFELVIGVTPDGNYYQRINDTNNPEPDPEQTRFELEGGRIFDSEKGEVKLPDGSSTKLTPTENDILKMLAKSNILKVSDYANELGVDEVHAANILKTYVKRIRKKIDSGDVSDSVIVNFRGFGYGLDK